jgi:hypothetical protein
VGNGSVRRHAKIIQSVATNKAEGGEMYTLTDEDMQRLSKDFSYHPPKPDQVPRYNEIRDYAKAFAAVLLEKCPPSRERSIALTNLENAVMWANASIARNE